MIAWLRTRDALIATVRRLRAERDEVLRDRGRMAGEYKATCDYLTERNAQLAAESQRIVASNHALLERAEKAEKERDALDERGAELGCHLQALLDTIKDHQTTINAFWQRITEAEGKLAKIAALGTVGMSHSLATAIKLAGGSDIRRAKYRQREASLRAENNARTDMVAF